jgi:hypothetical protein
MTTLTTAERVVIAFNLGSDARLNGYELTDNPHCLLSAGFEHDAWRSGWLYVHRFWGVAAKGRYPVRRLPILDADFVPEAE